MSEAPSSISQLSDVIASLEAIELENRTSIQKAIIAKIKRQVELLERSEENHTAELRTSLFSTESGEARPENHSEPEDETFLDSDIESCGEESIIDVPIELKIEQDNQRRSSERLNNYHNHVINAWEDQVPIIPNDIVSESDDDATVANDFVGQRVFQTDKRSNAINSNQIATKNSNLLQDRSDIGVALKDTSSALDIVIDNDVSYHENIAKPDIANRNLQRTAQTAESSNISRNLELSEEIEATNLQTTEATTPKLVINTPMLREGTGGTSLGVSIAPDCVDERLVKKDHKSSIVISDGTPRSEYNMYPIPKSRYNRAQSTPTPRGMLSETAMSGYNESESDKSIQTGGTKVRQLDNMNRRSMFIRASSSNLNEVSNPDKTSEPRGKSHVEEEFSSKKKMIIDDDLPKGDDDLIQRSDAHIAYVEESSPRVKELIGKDDENKTQKEQLKAKTPRASGITKTSFINLESVHQSFPEFVGRAKRFFSNQEYRQVVGMHDIILHKYLTTMVTVFRYHGNSESLSWHALKHLCESVKLKGDMYSENQSQFRIRELFEKLSKGRECIHPTQFTIIVIKLATLMHPHMALSSAVDEIVNRWLQPHMMSLLKPDLQSNHQKTENSEDKNSKIESKPSPPSIDMENMNISTASSSTSLKRHVKFLAITSRDEKKVVASLSQNEDLRESYIWTIRDVLTNGNFSKKNVVRTLFSDDHRVHYSLGEHDLLYLMISTHELPAQKGELVLGSFKRQFVKNWAPIISNFDETKLSNACLSIFSNIWELDSKIEDPTCDIATNPAFDDDSKYEKKKKKGVAPKHKMKNMSQRQSKAEALSSLKGDLPIQPASDIIAAHKPVTRKKQKKIKCPINSNPQIIRKSAATRPRESSYTPEINEKSRRIAESLTQAGFLKRLDVDTKRRRKEERKQQALKAERENNDRLSRISSRTFIRPEDADKTVQRLYGIEQERQRRRIQRAYWLERDNEDVQECTFTPDINKKSKLICKKKGRRPDAYLR
eukprot:TRINITY_DN233358_c0_g2_i1.p1 TRINITY_DN233358_c0_g2~~TRINITY_DN233358_c0_g2_i1.p1  ORF type:complete len:1006 (+),score=154.64 TRINITY_DN233358_c0_g2_i1:155-3172(+)